MWQPDVLPGYWQQTLPLGLDPDGEGQLFATLVRRGEAGEDALEEVAADAAADAAAGSGAATSTGASASKPAEFTLEPDPVDGSVAPHEGLDTVHIVMLCFVTC